MEALGIDYRIIIVQIINFGLLVYVLNKFLYKPVMKAVKAKREEFEIIENKKSEMAKEAQSAEKKRELMLRAAQNEKTETIKEARLEAAKQQKEAIEKAQAEAKTIIAKAKKEVEAEKANLAKNYERDVLEAAFAVAEKVVGKKANKDDVKKAYLELGDIKRQVMKG